jgi:hypothetical protein
VTRTSSPECSAESAQKIQSVGLGAIQVIGVERENSNLLFIPDLRSLNLLKSQLIKPGEIVQAKDRPLL